VDRKWLYATKNGLVEPIIPFHSLARRSAVQHTAINSNQNHHLLFHYGIVFPGSLQLVVFTRPRLSLTAPCLIRMHRYLRLAAATGPHSWGLLLDQAL